MTTKIDPLATVPVHERLKVSLTWLASFANEIERKGTVEFASDLARERALVFMRATLQSQLKLEHKEQELQSLRQQVKNLEASVSQHAQQLSMRSTRPTPTPAVHTPDRLQALSNTLKEQHETQAHSPAGPGPTDPEPHHHAADPHAGAAVGGHAEQSVDNSWLFD